MPIPCFGISRHMVVLVASSCSASPHATPATHYVCFIHRRVVPLRSLFPSLQSRIFSFQTVVRLVVVVLAQRSKLPSRRQAERYEGCFRGMLSRWPFSRNTNRGVCWFNLLSNLRRRSTESPAPANPRWGRVGWSHASHETSEYFLFRGCAAS